jgi:hypothetical protein
MKRDKRRAAVHGITPSPPSARPLQDVTNSPGLSCPSAHLNRLSQSPAPWMSTGFPSSPLVPPTPRLSPSSHASLQSHTPRGAVGNSPSAPSQARSPVPSTRSPSRSPSRDQAGSGRHARPPSRASSTHSELPEYPPPPGAAQPDDGTNDFFRNLVNFRDEDNANDRRDKDENADDLRDLHGDLGAGSEDEAENDENFGLPSDEEGDDDPPEQDRWMDLDLPNSDEELEPDDPGPDDNPFLADIPAFEEPSVLRNIYINAFIQKSLHGAKHVALSHFLRSFDELLTITIDPVDFARMARTIPTVERRLGLSCDDLVTTYTLCPNCRRRYSPAYIAHANEALCLNEGCNGILFADKTLASGTLKRSSALTYPCVSIKSWLRRMLSRDGIPELLQAWRKPGDTGPGEPVTAEAWFDQQDLDSPLGDVFDAHSWRMREAGLERVYNPQTGEVFDRSVLEQPLRFCNLPFGLSLSMNVDW